VVARQREIGIDLVNDGEYEHAMGHRYDYGSWWTYVFQRLGGLEVVHTRHSRSRRRDRSPDSSRWRASPSAETGTSSPAPAGRRQALDQRRRAPAASGRSDRPFCRRRWR
jgi:hypothetical protein